MSLMPVRAQALEKKHFAACYGIGAAALAGALIVGALNPLPISLERKPSADLGTNLDLRNSRCSVDMYGRSTSVESCWHHYFKFSHVWTQFFALDATFHLADEDRDKGLVEPVQMRVTWYGRSALGKGEESTCSGAENECTKCIDSWAMGNTSWVDPALHTNVARGCMPEACGQCNLECYLCLRRVELGDPDDENPHCVLSRDKDTGEDIDTDIKTLCTDEGEKSGGPAQQDWQVISEANQSMTRTINCPRDSNDCDRAVLFETSHVEFDEFYFQVELDGEDRNHHEWLKGVSFTMRYRNADFSLYEIGFRYAFSIINLVVWLIFECSVCRRKQVAQGMGISLSNGRRGRSFVDPSAGFEDGDSSSTRTRRASITDKIKTSRMPSSALWLRLLQIGLLLFNNPLYIFEYVVMARRFFGILGTIFQVCFLDFDGVSAGGV